MGDLVGVHALEISVSVCMYVSVCVCAPARMGERQGLESFIRRPSNSPIVSMRLEASLQI